MKRSIFISLFVVTHVLFIFFQIHKHNRVIKLSYQKQKLENEKKMLAQKKEELSQQWCNLIKHSTIKEFAKENLKMGKVKLNQVKKLTIDG